MLQAGFILLTIAMAVIVFRGAAYAAGPAVADNATRRRFLVRVVVLLVGWLGYVSVLSLLGVLKVGGLPPRIPLLLILPVFGFTAYFFASGRFKGIIAAVPPAWVVYTQSFRILVELLLLGLYLNGILPRAATFEGYNYDIVAGLTAPLVAWAGISRGLLPRVGLLLWNIAGCCTLAIIVFVAITHAYFPAMWPGSHLSIADFGSFPYTLLAGFLMPLAVFLHVLSIVQVRKGLVGR